MPNSTDNSATPSLLHDLPGSQRAPVTLSGQVDHVVYHSNESGFSVLRVSVSGRREPATVVGHAISVQPGQIVRAVGSWRNDRSWGHQFRADHLDVLLPSTADGIEAYLGSGLIKGLGRGLARRLLSAFGDDLLDVIENTPERLASVSGIGHELATRISDTWQQQQAVRDIMIFLHSHGLSPLRASRIFEVYGDAAVERVSANPYALARDVRSIGFHAADDVAARLGIARDSPLRVRAAITHVLLEALDAGHAGRPRSEIRQNVAELLAVTEDAVEAAIEAELDGGSVKAADVDSAACLFLGDVFDAETSIAQRLTCLAKGPLPWPPVAVDDALTWIQERLAIDLAAAQEDAVASALTSKVLIITGGPGTGKTTLVRSILAALPTADLEVVLAAPTGRAARRLTESTGHEARTLHRLLEAEPGKGFRRNAHRPLECELIVVDEMSMVDIVLMDALVQALPEHAALLLVGDVDQLPSIGPGQVLRDLIDSKSFAVVRLTDIFRQAEESRIVLNAHRINLGQMPDLARGENDVSDFYAIRIRGPDDGIQKILEVVAERIPNKFDLDPVDDVQVLCPTNRGPLGARMLNDRLQAALNPQPAESLEHHGITYAIGDKVMQTENDYDRDVYNGDIGRVVAVDRATRSLTVEIDGRPIPYTPDDLDCLVPAYAITVHKAQGSEYPVIVLPLIRQYGRMLRRNLVYTAVTRARRLVVVLAQPDALESAITARPQLRRISRLRDLLYAPSESDDP